MWTEVSVDEYLTEVGWSAEVDGAGIFLGNCGWWGLRRGCKNLI